MKPRNKALRRRCFKRDNFTCRKCKVIDKTECSLEAHHRMPLYLGGKDELENLITLCSDCHKFAPNNKKEFEEYIQEETEGTLTTLIQAWTKLKKDKPELFMKMEQESQGSHQAIVDEQVFQKAQEKLAKMRSK